MRLLVHRAALFIFVFALGVIFASLDQTRTKGVMTAIKISSDILKNKHSATGNWFPARFNRTGVLRHDRMRSEGGYILYTVAGDLSAHLIDMDGREYHRWSVSRNEIMPEASGELRTFFGLLKPQVDEAHLYPNGDLLLLYTQPAMGEWGGPLVKLDKQSHVLWKTKVKAHHGLQVLRDHIYVLTETVEPPASMPLVPSLTGMSYLDDKVTVLDPNGKELSSHSILRAISNTTDLRVADEVPFNDRADPLHANSLQVLDENTAKFIPGSKPGNVLVSLKHLDMIVAMDLETESIVWALRGSWRAQHDVKLLGNGHILLFDNQGGLSTYSRSRVLEVDPKTGGIVWAFAGTKNRPFESLTRGGEQWIESDGNMVIAESTSGRILEVARDGEVVWEYVQPIYEIDNGQELVAALGRGVVRYDPSYILFPPGTKR